MKFVAIAVIAAVVIFHVVESAPKRSDSATGRSRSQPPCSPDEDSFSGFDQRRGRQGGSNGSGRFGSRGGNRGGFQQDEDWEGDEN